MIISPEQMHNLSSVLVYHLPKKFHYILQCIRALEPHHPKLFNPLVKQNIKAAYVGGDLCGEATLVGKTLLEKEGINNIKVLRNERGSGEFYQDHCLIFYLLLYG